MNRLGHREAFLGVRDGGLEQFLPGELAVFLMDLRPAVHGAGDGEAMDARGGHRLRTLFGQELRRKRLGRGSRGVQADQFSGLALPVEDEEVSTETRLHRLDNSEHGVCSDRGIDCRSAFRKDLSCGLRRQCLAGGGDPLLGNDHRPAVIASLTVKRGQTDEHEADDCGEDPHSEIMRFR